MKHFQNNYYKMPLHRLILFVCVILFVIAGIPVIAHAADDKEVVRVGYYENEIFQEGAKEGEVKSGYAYEYYRKLSEYTGWEYEYVYGDFSELYQMLLDGEIDDKEKSAIPIVAVTANAFEEDKQNALGVGMNGHLAKPYDVPQS